MGSPSLQKKKELNYRCGTTSRNCGDCNHFVAATSPAEDYFSRSIEPRCKLIGLNPGRSYRIYRYNICDAHDNSEYLKRLKEGTSFANR
jgi:hypothetical protein